MSSAQQHRVLRLVIELAGCSRDQAGALQTALRQRFAQDWLPTIERTCDALGPPGRVQRIDRLEIDLGAVPGPALLLGPGGPPFDGLFAQQLAQALRTAPHADTDLELVDFYLHTGALPWWADSADRLAVHSAVWALLQNPSPGWLALLGGLGDQPRRRLLAALDDGLLARLLGQQLAGGPGTAPDSAWPPALQAVWPQVLGRAASALALPAHTLRTAWWQAALAAAAVPGAAGAPDRWWAAALAGMASGLMVQAAALQQALGHAVEGADAAQPGLGALRALLARARPAHAPHLPPPATAAPAGAAAGAGKGADGTDADGTGDATGADGTGDASADGTGTVGTDAVADGRWAPAAGDQEGGPLAPVPAQRAGSARRPGPQSAPPGAHLAPAPSATPALPGPDGGPGLAPAWPGGAAAAGRPHGAAAAAPRPAPVHPRHQADALYLANAGLVLLWPFLPRFFLHLGLWADARWARPAAAQRAARLLQCVASGDADPPEFQLPLNKLLCGLPLDDALLDDAPLTDPEQAECSALLQAVIAQAPILREMSVAGFRASFLLRPGQLSSRDGHWLLRVERQTYDVVIDRFPWGLGIVRLPWMPTLLQVQW